MNWYVITTVLSYTIFPATFIAVWNYWQRRFTYLPFLLLLVTASLNEVVSTLVIFQGQSNAVNNNVYVLAECLLVIWLFAEWEPNKRKTGWYKIATIVLVLIWIADNIIFHSIASFNQVFKISFAVVAVIMSCDQLSYLLTNHSSLRGNSRLILCIVFFVTYSFKTFTEMFVAFNPDYSNSFYEAFFFIWITINTLSNVSFLIAAIWMSKRERYYISYL